MAERRRQVRRLLTRERKQLLTERAKSSMNRPGCSTACPPQQRWRQAISTPPVTEKMTLVTSATACTWQMAHSHLQYAATALRHQPTIMKRAVCGRQKSGRWRGIGGRLLRHVRHGGSRAAAVSPRRQRGTSPRRTRRMRLWRQSLAHTSTLCIKKEAPRAMLAQRRMRRRLGQRESIVKASTTVESGDEFDANIQCEGIHDSGDDQGRHSISHV